MESLPNKRFFFCSSRVRTSSCCWLARVRCWRWLEVVSLLSMPRLEVKREATYAASFKFCSILDLMFVSLFTYYSF